MQFNKWYIGKFKVISGQCYFQVFLIHLNSAISLKSPVNVQVSLLYILLLFGVNKFEREMKKKKSKED